MTDEQVRKLADAIRSAGTSVCYGLFLVTCALYMHACVGAGR